MEGLNGENEPMGMVFPEGLRQAPTLCKIDLEGITFRWGTGLTNEGEPVGVILEFWFPPMPWLKFRIPFERLSAIGFKNKLEQALELGAETETSET